MPRCAGQSLPCIRLAGGQHGPSRLLTGAVTYAVVFSIGYGLGLGLLFGVASGITTGLTLSIELNRAARGLDHYSLLWEGVFSAIRGIGFGVGLYRIVGFQFAIAFSLLITIGQIFAYSRGMRPAMDYMAARRPRLTRRQLWRTVVRTVGYIGSAVICDTFIHHVEHTWAFAARTGLVTGLVTGVGATVNPYIEYYADHFPDRRLGAFEDWPHSVWFFNAISSILVGAVRRSPELRSLEIDGRSRLPEAL